MAPKLLGPHLPAHLCPAGRRFGLLSSGEHRSPDMVHVLPPLWARAFSPRSENPAGRPRARVSEHALGATLTTMGPRLLSELQEAPGSYSVKRGSGGCRGSKSPLKRACQVIVESRLSKARVRIPA